MALILNQAQAEAVYSAMCALNNVGGRICTELQDRYGNEIRVLESWDGVTVTLNTGGIVRERDSITYADQHAFATAYGLTN